MKKTTFQKFLVLGLILVLMSLAISPALAANNRRVWVEFSPGKSAQAQAALENFSANFHYSFENLNSFVVTIPENALQPLSNNPNIISIEEDPERYPISIDPSLGSFAPSSDSTDLNGQTVPWGLDAVQARDIWDTNRDGFVDSGVPAGAGKTVCIIDSGFYYDHEDLNNSNLIGGVSQVDNDYTRDGLGHGSHVAGTILANNNSLGLVGVSPNVSVYIVKFFNDAGSATFASDLVDAANTCANNGADIISMSLGGSRSNGKENRAFKNLYEQGVLSIAAAGNDGNTAHSYPASYDYVVSVAALDENLQIADFSQQTSQVEVAAPGVAVYSTVPYIDISSLNVNSISYDVNHVEFSARGNTTGSLVNGGLCTSSGSWAGSVVLCERGEISFYDKVMNAQNGGASAVLIFNNVPGNFFGTLGDGNSSTVIGLSLSQADGQNLLANALGSSVSLSSEYYPNSSGYAYYDGTSMATPHVSAVAALIWSAVPNASNIEVRQALSATAYDLGAGGRDDAFGNGLIQALPALAYLNSGSGSNNAPTVTIDNPANGSNFDSGVQVTFNASASDAEDGDLSTSVSWSSNLDGPLGTGASVQAILSEGTHSITAAVSDSGGQSGTDSISVTIDPVGGGSGGMHITVSTDQASYPTRDTALISANVSDDNSIPINGANVEIRIVTAKGKTYVGSATSDASGNVTFNFKVNAKKDGSGLYTVTATATKPGYSDASDSTNFSVN